MPLVDVETSAVPVTASPSVWFGAGPFAWYTGLSKVEKITFWSCYGGVALDAMDLRIFSFLIPVLMKAWHVAPAQAGLLGSAALYAAAAGGWITGLLGDWFGRVKAMQFTIVIYSVFTFLSGFATSYDQLFICRTIQGFGFGGEITAGVVLMAEIVGHQNRGRAVGCLQSGVAVGWALAAVIASVAIALLPETIAWRAVFWSGILPGLLLIVIRRHVDEPEIYKECREQAIERAARMKIHDIFRPAILRHTTLSTLLALGVQTSGLGISTWLPAYLTLSRHLSPAATGLYVIVLTAGAFFGYIGSAYLSDARGRRPNFFIYVTGSIAILTAYLCIPMPGWALLVAGFPLGFFSQGLYGGMGTFFSELFPTQIRASGTSFAYSAGRLGAASGVALVGALAHGIGIGAALLWVCLASYLLVMIATMLLPETGQRARPAA
ncbi:MFS transporter [Gluconacetobacter sacchari]|uniref:MFS transporter n=2 Tax=Gluconacetobacter sacchari TaxID=92759 RepID=A0A7W4I9B0_9PROT|nr:MFS transporter [Gluconacetobacter sacchari]MBB2158584.1 MFS transporter [Gluconacetobacter sacchari]GBQ26581.1 major facilitator superfamily transporter [Gluconacetobacter sacchari DSM 12717]